MTEIGKTNFSINSEKFNAIYRGTVVDNSDASQCGKVKIKVYPMLADVATANLPWAVPAYPIVEGSGSGIGYFAVPDVGTNVFVFFEMGDIYQPVYFAEAPDALKGLPTERTTNYPNRKVVKFSSGIRFIVDDTAKKIIVQTAGGIIGTIDDTALTVKLEHPTGTTITVDVNGKVTVYSVDSVAVTALKNVELYAGQHIYVTAANALNEIDPIKFDITGNVDMNISGKIDISAANINLNP